MAENDITSILEGNISVHFNTLNVKPNVLSTVVAKPTKEGSSLSAAHNTLRDRTSVCSPWDLQGSTQADCCFW